MSDVPPPPPPPGYGQGQPVPPPPPPSGVPGYGPQGYGSVPMPPGYAPGQYGGMQREHPSGTTVLTLGILGLVLGFGCCIGFVLSPIAWVKGGSARREMDAEPGVYWTNKGNVTAGWICGIIGTCLLALGVLGLVIFAIAAAAAGS